MSFDGANLTLPHPDRQPNAAWPHVDQSPKRKGLQCVQGLLNLAPNGPRDGGLIVLRGSSLLNEAFFKAHPGAGERTCGFCFLHPLFFFFFSFSQKGGAAPRLSLPLRSSGAFRWSRKVIGLSACQGGKQAGWLNAAVFFLRDLSGSREKDEHSPGLTRPSSIPKIMLITHRIPVPWPQHPPHPPCLPPVLHSPPPPSPLIQASKRVTDRLADHRYRQQGAPRTGSVSKRKRCAGSWTAAARWSRCARTRATSSSGTAGRCTTTVCPRARP